MSATTSSRLPASAITPKADWLRRRDFLRLGAAGAGALLLGAGRGEAASRGEQHGEKLAGLKPGPFGTDEPKNTFKQITSYNNFYEFGTDKADPHENAHTLRPRPWSVTVAGNAEVKGTFTLEDILKGLALEERVYRFRCVEAWSMVVPWLGFPLASLLQRFKPTANAKYVEFTTLYDPRQMPGERYAILQWPYVEGLRIDEAMHPLTLVVVGVYGQWLPNQNGAPLRLVMPWKYGFKGIKSIVKIAFTETQPRNTWNIAAPDEYGFYANVNPHVDHPRWSQASERRIGKGLFFTRQPTLMFNGYEREVADLYKGMDLKRYF